VVLVSTWTGDVPFTCSHTLFIGASQLWITYESPATLVDRYGEYGHGDPDRERRVVLNRTLLPESRHALGGGLAMNLIRKVDATDLLYRRVGKGCLGDCVI